MKERTSNREELMPDKRGAMLVTWRKRNGNTISSSCTKCHHGLRDVMVIQNLYCTEHEVIKQSSEVCSQKYVTAKFRNLNFCKYPEVPSGFLLNYF
jgi:hypothetical protein